MKYLGVKDKFKICFFIALLVLAIIFFPKLAYLYQDIELFLQEAGLLGPLLYMLLMILAIVISPVPASPLAIISGIVFGPWLGMLYTLLSATIGAVIALLIARFFLRESLELRFRKAHIYKKILLADENKLAYIILLTRLMPQVSFDIVSYASGLTHIKVWKFALATFIGMIPIVFILTFFGDIIKPYKIIVLFVLLAIFIIYSIYQIIKSKRYYVEGY